MVVTASSAVAQEPEAYRQKRLMEFLTWCGELPTVEERDYPIGSKTALLINIQSDNPYCGGVYLEVEDGDRYYLGQPWMLLQIEGDLETRIEQYAWQRMNQKASASVAERRPPEKFHETTVSLTTEYGTIELTGETDPDSKVFFPGGFLEGDGSYRDKRLTTVSEVAITAPVLGSAERVELIEFSDFQCPSCKRAAATVDAILDEYGEQITYRRIDYPLMGMHPWAFPAALYGRAIYRQDPTAFWEYKAAVFENQDELNAFTLEDFALGFAGSRDLDVDKIRSDVASEELRKEILAAIAVGYMAEIRGTPTFWLNGQPVALGHDGEVLRAAIEQALSDSSSD